jgi:hypothetical protein
MAEQQEVKPGITLPTTKTKARMINPKNFLLYGQPKIGKTTILSELENCLIIDLESGTKYLDALKIEVSSLKEFTEIGKAIVEAGKPYKYVAIDSITQLEKWCEGHATQTYMNSPVGKKFNRDASGKVNDNKSVLTLPDGGGYFWLRKSFDIFRDFSLTLADHVIFVGHVKDKMIDKGGMEVAAKDIDLTGQLKRIACADADAVGYIYRKNGKLMISFETSDEVTCGSRIPHLRGQTFEFDWSKIYID